MYHRRRAPYVRFSTRIPGTGVNLSIGQNFGPGIIIIGLALIILRALFG